MAERKKAVPSGAKSPRRVAPAGRPRGAAASARAKKPRDGQPVGPPSDAPGNDTVEHLRCFPFFQGLSDDVMAKLSSIVREESYSRGDVVFEEGSPGDAVYFVVSGEVSVLKTIDAKKGEYKSLGVIAGEELFGEMAFFDDRPRSARVEARSDLHALRIACEDFRRFLMEDARAASTVLFRIITLLSRRLREGAREQVALYETGKLIASCEGPAELVERVFGILMQAVPTADSGLLALYNKFTEELEIKASRGFAPGELGDSLISLDEPIVARMMRTHACREGDPSREPLFNGRFAGYRTAAGYPIVSGSELLGLLIVFSADQESAFTYAQKNLLESVCSQMAPALVNAAYRREDLDRSRLKRFHF